jgi:hypothetical protein
LDKNSKGTFHGDLNAQAQGRLGVFRFRKPRNHVPVPGRKKIALLGPCGLTARSDHPVVPPGPLGVSPDPPAVPSGPRGVSVPSGLFGVPPHSPTCPPVPLVSLGSYSSIIIV